MVNFMGINIEKSIILVKRMAIITFLSLIIILFLENQNFLKLLYYFFDLKENRIITFENIIIGVFGSSCITLISSFCELFIEIKKLKKDMIVYYRDIYENLIYKIEKKRKKDIYKIMVEKNEIYILYSIIKWYVPIVMIYKLWIYCLNYITNNDLDVDTYKYCSIYIRLANVLYEVYLYYYNMTCCYYKEKYYLMEYQKVHNNKEKNVNKNEQLDLLKKSYKICLKREKEIKKRLFDLKLV